MKKIVIPMLLATGVLAMTSCRKDPVKNLSGDEGLIYITKHSDSVSFSSFRTFSIADSVAVISNNKLEGKVRTDVDAAYINAVKDQLVQRGYTQVARNQNPDLGITVRTVEVHRYNIIRKLKTENSISLVSYLHQNPYVLERVSIV